MIFFNMSCAHLYSLTGKYPKGAAKRKQNVEDHMRCMRSKNSETAKIPQLKRNKQLISLFFKHSKFTVYDLPKLSCYLYKNSMSIV